MFDISHFDELYCEILEGLAHRKSCETYALENERTGEVCFAYNEPVCFTTDLQKYGFPVALNRRYYPHIALAESIWQMMGTTDAAWINKVAPKLWSKFTEDGEVKNAYGYRMRTHFLRDQITLLIEQLVNNPSSRQNYVSLWDPKIDGLGAKGANMPCPVSFNYTWPGGKDLDMQVVMRSSDVMLGLPYDVMNFAILHNAISHTAGYHARYMSFILLNAHLYEQHIDEARESIRLWRDFNQEHTMKTPILSIDSLYPKHYETNANMFKHYYEKYTDGLRLYEPTTLEVVV